MPASRFAVWTRAVGLAGFCLAAPASAAGFDASARYVVSLAGLNIATVAVDFVEDGSAYAIDIGADVSGVGTLVASGTASAESSGRAANGGLAASGFNLTTRTRSQQFNVAVQYASGNATGFQVDPPLVNNIGRVALERKDLKGVTDPLGSFILKGEALSPELCDRRLKVFTGIERYDIAMTFAGAQNATSTRAGYQGPVIVCHLRYIPVSGHFETSEMTRYLASSERILIWYAPLRDTGYFIPYRILLGTAAGDLAMVLTALE